MGLLCTEMLLEVTLWSQITLSWYQQTQAVGEGHESLPGAALGRAEPPWRALAPPRVPLPLSDTGQVLAGGALGPKGRAGRFLERMEDLGPSSHSGSQTPGGMNSELLEGVLLLW